MGRGEGLLTLLLVLSLVLVAQITCRAVELDDEEDGNTDYDEEEEEQSKRNQAGVLDIIGGAFSGDLNKILSGSFKFTDREIGDKLLPQITGAKPKPKETSNNVKEND